MTKRAVTLLVAASLAVGSCGSSDPVIMDAPAPRPTLTAQQARAVSDAILTVDRAERAWCLTAMSEALDLDVDEMCLRVPFAAVELMHISGVPHGLFDDRYSAISLWIMPLAEAVVDVEAREGQADPIFRGESGALMIISEAVSNVEPMTLVVVHGGRTFRCPLPHGSNNCPGE